MTRNSALLRPTYFSVGIHALNLNTILKLQVTRHCSNNKSVTEACTKRKYSSYINFTPLVFHWAQAQGVHGLCTWWHKSSLFELHCTKYQILSPRHADRVDVNIRPEAGLVDTGSRDLLPTLLRGSSAAQNDKTTV